MDRVIHHIKVLSVVIRVDSKQNQMPQTIIGMGRVIHHIKVLSDVIRKFFPSKDREKPV